MRRFLWIAGVLVTLPCLAMQQQGGSHMASAARPPVGQDNQDELQRVRARFQDELYQELLLGASWRLSHCADPSQVKENQTALEATGAVVFDEAALNEPGRLKALNEQVATLLEAEDPTIRGFEAIVLGVIGHPASAPKIAKLLDRTDKVLAEQNRLSPRGQAAIALGILGAKQYTQDLARVLDSADSDTQSGAILGLGLLGAKDHAPAIAHFLTEDYEEKALSKERGASVDLGELQRCAIMSLALMDAKDFAGAIAARLSGGSDVDVPKDAAYALVRLRAKECSDQMAALLEDKYRKGDAAKALALLGADQYTARIAQLLDDESFLVRKDAALALGILQATQYADAVGQRLHDDQDSVRTQAAIAILLMGARRQEKEALGVLEELSVPEEGLARHIDHLHPLVASDYRAIKARAEKAPARLKGVCRTGDTCFPCNGQDGSAVGSLPSMP